MTTFWNNKNVIITGASSGIGWTLAEMLARRGARLGLVARRADKLDALVSQLRDAGHTVHAAPADVTDRVATEAALAKLTAKLGPCDVLIANAGIHKHTPGKDFRSSDAAQVVTVNVHGVIHAIGGVLPQMVARGQGKLVAIASIAGYLGLPLAGAYSASKSAVITLMDSLRVDLAGTGVETLTICPGYIDTPLLENHEKRKLSMMLTVEQACARIVRAMERKTGRYSFPWQTVALARFARRLPWPLFLPLARYAARRSGPKRGD